MNDTTPTPAPSAEESAESIFQRIQRRRTPAAATSAAQAPDPSSPAHPRNEAVPRHIAGQAASSPRSARERHTTSRSTRRPPLLLDETGTPLEEEDTSSDGAVPSSSDFPRSKTLQTLLRYPTVTTAIGLTVGITTATRLLQKPAARQTIYRLGKFAAEQQIWKYVRKLTDH